MFCKRAQGSKVDKFNGVSVPTGVDAHTDSPEVGKGADRTIAYESRITAHSCLDGCIQAGQKHKLGIRDTASWILVLCRRPGRNNCVAAPNRP
jgi:hypothetical protein